MGKFRKAILPYALLFTITPLLSGEGTNSQVSSTAQFYEKHAELGGDTPLAPSLYEEVENFYQNYAEIGGETPLNQAENLGLNEEKFKYNIERDSVALVYDEDGTVTGKVESRKNIVSDSDVNLQAIEGRVAKVLVYGDEEYRSKYGNDWQKRAEAIVERADDEFNREFDIDLDIRSYGSWSSNGNNSNEILSDLRGSGVTSYDFVIGFTGDNNFTKEGELIGSLAYRYTSNPTYGGYSVVSDQLQLTTAHTLQHELSYNYSLEPDLITSGLICIMNYETMYDTWNWHSAHREQLAVRSGWFGTAIN